MAVEQFLVRQMTGSHAVDAIAREIHKIRGVRAVQVHVSTKSVRVEHDGSVRIHTLMTAINQAGYSDVAVLA